MEDKYVPVACSFYDHFEIAGVRKTQVELTLVDGSKIVDRIDTLESKSGKGEYAILSSGKEIRLDKVKMINDQSNSGLC